MGWRMDSRDAKWAEVLKKFGSRCGKLSSGNLSKALLSTHFDALLHRITHFYFLVSKYVCKHNCMNATRSFK